MVLWTLFFIVVGYLSGSILFARLMESVTKKEIVEDSPDQNPGTANAFMYGGFWCGFITLLGDLAKGFLPVFLYLIVCKGYITPFGFSLVFAAPVIGHIFPLYYHFKGGKGIAVTFGCLVGLAPVDIVPLACMVVMFVIFSTVLRVNPHSLRTIITYIATFILIAVVDRNVWITIGFVLMTLSVLTRIKISDEEKQAAQVNFLWSGRKRNS